jgi:hypothetical protein
MNKLFLQSYVYTENNSTYFVSTIYREDSTIYRNWYYEHAIKKGNDFTLIHDYGASGVKSSAIEAHCDIVKRLHNGETIEDFNKEV